MNYKTRIAALAASVGIVALAGACKPDLNITNPNTPDVARAISSPGDVRNLIGGSFNTWFFGMQGTDARSLPRTRHVGHGRQHDHVVW